MSPPPDQTPGMMHPPEMPPQEAHRPFWLATAGILVILLIGGAILWWAAKEDSGYKQATTQQTVRSGETPRLTNERVLGDRDHVWEIAFLPTQEMIFTERGGTVSVVKDGKAQALADINDVYVRGEGGLMGLAVDPDFTANNYIYT